MVCVYDLLSLTVDPSYRVTISPHPIVASSPLPLSPLLSSSPLSSPLPLSPLLILTSPLFILTDPNKWVTQGPGLAQAPYTSGNRTGSIYGYGTLTINSATVATWNMYKNDVTKSPGQISIDTLLICNTFNTGSAICPFKTIPVRKGNCKIKVVQVRQCHIVPCFISSHHITPHHVTSCLFVSYII
jgi:hypothetical protein